MPHRTSARSGAPVVSVVPASGQPRVSHRHVELDGGHAFLPDSRHGAAVMTDDEVEAMGEEFIATATSAESVAETARDEEVADELEGLHVETIAGEDDEEP